MDRPSAPTAIVPQVDAGTVEWIDRETAVAENPATAIDEAVAEREFIQAIEAYKQASGRMFPTWSEVLEVLTGLGYVKNAQ